MIRERTGAASGSGDEGGADESGTQTEDSGEQEWQPKVEDVYLFRAPDAKTKKPGKPVECEVIAVDEKTRTVKLKNLANPKATYDKVAWDALEGQ